ncbi:penicillin-binding protein 2 [Enterobacteriaceae endosymbiont of Donacia bicoloricornis]|uniref:penicillin-binding protein 2 n=1 Tax=Enterobacteriaceae endosymbiont of Donacia bicoloricornis TaxID=2675772 RepID=UPI00144A0ED1|nr:penicillin-binding protein 2 [Enterobacteriaceae endosymbiont of Donacia bicoloricornis]QJC37812.1 penicillin-binding protein 2 [Enterobacteriaceae endosymbiont of Donacia bicoloricornis]
MYIKYNFSQNYKIKSKIFFQRTKFLIKTFLILFSILIFNLYYLQIRSYKKYKLQAEQNYVGFFFLKPNRGLIYDRNGIVLAKNKSFYQIKIQTNNINDFLQKIIFLQKFLKLKINKSDIAKVTKSKKEKKSLKKIIFKIDLNNRQASKFLVNKYLFPEIPLKIYQKRFYPQKKLFAHVVGYIHSDANKKKNIFKKKKTIKNYTDNSSVGINGIEKYYQKKMYGTNGYQKIAINNKGFYKYTICKEESYTGKDIFLTIDYKLQKYIYSLMKDKKGAVIISDTRNGEILAMISTPSFDPNLFLNNKKEKSLHFLLKNKMIANHPLINRAIQGIYPPASTVKPYMTLLALKLNLINEHTILFDPGWWKIPKFNQKYKDWKKNGHGYLNVNKAIQESSDFFFYKLAYNIGINKIHTWMDKFGYGKLTNIDLFNEKLGNLPTRQWKLNSTDTPWYIGDTISVGIGQSYWNATPIQIHNALTILVNNGISKPLHLYKKEKLNNIFSYYIHKKYKKVVNFPIQYWNIVKNGMFNVVNKKNGTLYKYFLNIKNYSIAAKTGTAQVFNLNNLKKHNINKIKEKLRDHKLIIAFAPFKHPKIAMTIIIENSNKDIFIGNIARKIFDYIFENKKDLLI